MPTYDFECPTCGRRFEKRIVISDRNKPQECTECKKPASRCLTIANLNGFDEYGRSKKS